MRYVRYNYIKGDSAFIPDGEVFTVFRQEDETWAFAMKIRDKFTLTKFLSQKVDEGGVRQAKKQILFCKNYGWSYTGFKSMNTEVDEEEPEFVCMYCDQRTFDTSKPCLCRNKKIEDMTKKTPGGLILPI